MGFLTFELSINICPFLKSQAALALQTVPRRPMEAKAIRMGRLSLVVMVVVSVVVAAASSVLLLFMSVIIVESSSFRRRTGNEISNLSLPQKLDMTTF